MSDRVAAQAQQTADIGRRLEMHAHEMTSRMFASAKKGGAAVGPTRRGKGTHCSQAVFLGVREQIVH
jgi:hypothetical protein